MLTATALALGAAVLHAGWNLAVKQSGDRFCALWGPFTIVAVPCALAVAVLGMPARGWIWAGVSGLCHVPYTWYLARAYDAGEFSVVYPVARGTGAALGALGGVVVLGDRLGPGVVAGIAVVAAGLIALAGRATPRPVLHALIVGAAIGCYSTSDAHGIRSTGTAVYALASFVPCALTISAAGVLGGRGPAMRAAMATLWRRYLLTGAAVVVTYAMVQIAFRYAPVGYVGALRESSVVVATLAGWRFLGEPGGRRRVAAATVVLAGLIVIVTFR